MPGADHLYYDGACGLCHRSVRFVLHHDRTGAAFRFAPLGGETFQREIPEAQRRELADSIVVRTSGGRLLVRSAAVLYVLDRLGGGWRGLGRIGRCAPRPLRDWLYDRIAGVRHRLFAKPADACPVLPAELRGRFDP